MNAADGTFAINTYSYTMGYTAESCIDHLAAQGFRAVELMMYPGHLWPAHMTGADRVALRRRLEGADMRVTTLNMPNIDINIAGASAEMRGYSMGLLNGIVDLAGELGAPGVIIGPGKANPLFPAPKAQLTGYFHAALDALIPRAAKAGTSIFVENMPFAFLPGIDELLDALARSGHDGIGVVYDLANGHFIKEELGAALRKCRHRLRLVHLSDTGHQAYRHDPVGRGSVPFGAIPPVLKEIGYRGPAMLEIISPDADADIAHSIAQLTAMGWAPQP